MPKAKAARSASRASDLTAILGAPKFESEMAMRTSVPGVATGLAWTPVGGDILFIEATRIPGTGRLILTGQLGDVMKESAQAALSIVKNRAATLGIDASRFEKSDIHIHVPAGAIPKDGPSAGVAMFMALVSLLTDRTVRSDTAMTGEISLRGLVLPVGGIKEKVLAAHAPASSASCCRRATEGITTIFPKSRARRWSSSGSNASMKRSRPRSSPRRRRALLSPRLSLRTPMRKNSLSPCAGEGPERSEGGEQSSKHAFKCLLSIAERLLQKVLGARVAALESV